MIKTLGLYKQKNLNINPDILEKLDDEIDYLKDTKGFNGAYKELDDIELNPTDGHFVGANIQGVLFGYGSNKTIIDPDGIPIVDPVNTPPTNGANIPCNKTSL